MDYKQKYLKYKSRYLELKQLYGGADGDEENTEKKEGENNTETKPEETKPEDKPAETNSDSSSSNTESSYNNTESSSNTDKKDCNDLALIYKPTYNFDNKLKYGDRKKNLDEQVKNYLECKLDDLEKLAEKAKNDIKKYYRLVYEIDRRDDACLDNVIERECEINNKCTWNSFRNRCISRCKFCSMNECGNKGNDCMDCVYNFKKSKCLQKPMLDIAKAEGL